VVGPLEPGGGAAEIGDEFADVRAHPEGEHLHAGRLEVRAKREAGVEVSVRLAVPGPPETTAALGLALGDHGERDRLAGGELAGGFVVGAVDLFDELQVKLASAVTPVGLHESGVEAGGTVDQAITAGAHGF